MSVAVVMQFHFIICLIECPPHINLFKQYFSVYALFQVRQLITSFMDHLMMSGQTDRSLHLVLTRMPNVIACDWV